MSSPYAPPNQGGYAPQPGFNIQPQQPNYGGYNPAQQQYPYPPPNQGGYVPQPSNIPMLAPGQQKYQKKNLSFLLIFKIIFCFDKLLGEVAMPMPQINISNCPPGLEYLTQGMYLNYSSS